MSQNRSRIDWVDYSKGLCIILVVLMHATIGTEKASGGVSALHDFIEWARPFRMPDFFLISGLFLASRIDRPWHSYLDSKLVHFGYFYLLWEAIQLLFKGPALLHAGGLQAVFDAFALGLIEPFGTLWFIYMLALLFVAVKLLRNVPPVLVIAIGAVLQTVHIETGWLIIDEFAARFVYFYLGYALADLVFDFSQRVEKANIAVVASSLAAWACINAVAVGSGVARLPVFSLVLGLAGAAAVIAAGVLLAKTRFAGGIRICGSKSIVIYLAFFLFMAGARTVLLHSPLATHLTLVAVIATFAGVAGPLLLNALTRDTVLDFLFKRPDWAKLSNYDGARTARFRARLARIQQPRICLPAARSSGARRSS